MAYSVNYPEPPLELIKGKEEYVVDWILNSQQYGRNKQLQFLIHWEGYSAAHNSWEWAINVHTPMKVEEYYQQKKGAVRAISIKDDAKGDERYPTDPLILPLLACSWTHLMADGMPQQPQQPTTTIPEYRGQDRDHNQHSGVARWYNNDTWFYARSMLTATTPNSLADDNWQRLYQAILNINPTEENALSFDDTPRLTEDANQHWDILTLPLTKDFNFTTTFENSTTNLSHNTQNHLDTTFSIAPVNSTAALPWDKNQFMSTVNFKPL